MRELVNRPGQGKVMVIDGEAVPCAAPPAWGSVGHQGGGAGVGRDPDQRGRTGCGHPGQPGAGGQGAGSCPVKTEKRAWASWMPWFPLPGVTIAPGDYVYADLNGVLVSGARLL